MYLMSTTKSRSLRENEKPVLSCLGEQSDRRTVETACFPSTGRLNCSQNLDEVSEEGGISPHCWASTRPKLLPTGKTFPAFGKPPLLTKPSLNYTRPLMCESDVSMADGCFRELTMNHPFLSREGECSIDPFARLSFESFSPESRLKQPSRAYACGAVRTPRQRSDKSQQTAVLLLESTKQIESPLAQYCLQRETLSFRMIPTFKPPHDQSLLSRPRDQRQSQARRTGKPGLFSLKLSLNNKKTLKSAVRRLDQVVNSDGTSLRPQLSSSELLTPSTEVSSNQITPRTRS